MLKIQILISTKCHLFFAGKLENDFNGKIVGATAILLLINTTKQYNYKICVRNAKTTKSDSNTHFMLPELCDVLSCNGRKQLSR